MNEHSLKYALDIAERVNESSEEQNKFFDAIRERFNTGSQFIILQTLLLLDIVVKNSNRYVKLDVSSRAFVNCLRKITKLNNEKVNQRLLSVIMGWLKLNEFVGPEHDMMREMQGELAAIVPSQRLVREDNIAAQALFNEPLPVAVTQGPSFAASACRKNDEKFSQDLRTAIEISLKEQKGTYDHKTGDTRKSNLVKALYDFEDVEEGELSFKIGDRITIIDNSQPYWWKGVCDGRLGVFPATFVTPFDDTEVDTTQVSAMKTDEPELKEPLVDEKALDQCLDMLRSADIEAMPGSDSPEQLELEERCIGMASIIESEISKLDSLVDSCQTSHEKLLEAIRLYDNECQLEASRLLAKPRT